MPARQTNKKKAPARKTTATRKTTKKPAGRTTSTNNKKVANGHSVLFDEAMLLITAAIGIFMFVANFGICGKVGTWIAKLFFGIFGVPQFLLPIVIVGLFAFAFANQYSAYVMKKIGLSVVLLVMVCAFFQLLHNIDGSVFDTFKYSAGDKFHRGGGMIGSLVCGFIYPFLSTAGTCSFVILAIIILTMLISNTSVLDIYRGIVNLFSEDEEELQARKEKEAIKKAEEEEYRRYKKEQRLAKIQQETMERTKRKNELEQRREQIQQQSGNDLFRQMTVLDEAGQPVTDQLKTEPEQKMPIMGEQKAPNVKPFDKDMHEITADKEVASKQEKPVRKRRTKEQSLEVQSEIKQDLSQIPIVGLVETKAEFVSEEEAATKEEEAKETLTNLAKEEPVVPKEPVKRRTKASAQETREQVLETQKEVSKEAVHTNTKQYQFPVIDLLSKGENKKTNTEEHTRETARKLQETLENFGVRVTMTNVSCGPAVTRYEMQPEQGVKVSKIVGLADDIKLNLAAADIRIEAPIPGKAAVGIEVPNKENVTVAFRDLIEQSDFMKKSSDLAFAVGKDIAGKVVVSDIEKMPHVLIAGATGSGKSVCINTLIMSLLYKSHPDDVKLIMIDPKVVELSVYNGIPHLLIPVVTDPKKASGALNWAVAEMTERYKKFAQYNVRNLAGYNKMVEEELKKGIHSDDELKKMPKIVIIVDELADLMMVAQKEVEDAIVRLSQLARAAGIHLVIATQRPSVDVITGLIKANVPSRIAFSVSSGVDSRTILDMNGAEKLLGKGDMLFAPSGIPKPIRVQGAFISDKDVGRVVDFLKEQGGSVEYDQAITKEINCGPQAMRAMGEEKERDEYFVEAGNFIIEKNKASIGMLQRVFKIGFNRAARIMDQLADAGVVGPEEGTKPRTILMSQEEFEQVISEL